MCLFAFKREDSNPAKAATFLPLQCILEWHLPIPDERTAIELAKAYQNAYQRVKTLTGTVKGDILQTLGHLLDAQPQVTTALGHQHRPQISIGLLMQGCLQDLVHHDCLMQHMIQVCTGAGV